MPWRFGTQSLLWILNGFRDCRRRFHGLERQLEPQTHPKRVQPHVWILGYEVSDGIRHAQPAQLPTQHVKCLNPHLDHAAFDALYTTEHTVVSSVECYDLLRRCTGMDSK